MVILLIIGILCILGAIALGIMAFLTGSPDRKSAAAGEPLPGGGGSYVLAVEGMTSTSKVAAVEAALGTFKTLTAETDPEEGTVTIRYQGYPDLKLLDAVKQAVESTGCTVSEID